MNIDIKEILFFDFIAIVLHPVALGISLEVALSKRMRQSDRELYLGSRASLFEMLIVKVRIVILAHH
jgi:hypothetical protein